MKQCSSDARTMGHPTHSPFEFTATGLGEKGKTLVGRAQFGPALLLNRRTTPALLELAYGLKTESQAEQALIDSRWTGSAR